MLFVGIAELKAKLSEYLARVKSGEEIVVAGRGKPVARLIPVGPPASADVESRRLLAMARDGVVRLGTTNLPDVCWKMERPEDPGASLRSALLEERREGR